MARTTNGGLTRIDSSPGDLTLFNTMILDAASLIAGFTNSINVAGTGETAMLQADLRAKAVSLAGLLTGARTLTWPTTECARAVIFRNATTGSFSLTIKVSGGLGVIIPQGFAQMLWHDGVNVYAAGPAISVATGLMAQSGLSVPRAHVTHSAVQAVASGVALYLAFNTERTDTHGQHDNATNNSRLICQEAGDYMIYAGAEFESNATGWRSLALRYNGTTTYIGSFVVPAVSGAVTRLQVNSNGPAALAGGDYIEVEAIHNAGVSLNIGATNAITPEFGWHKVG